MFRCRAFEIKNDRFLLIILIAIQSFALVVNACLCSPVFDEYGHFYAGLAYWQFGNTQIFNVNPPLGRALGAIPAYFVYEKQLAAPVDRLTRQEFPRGRDLFVANPLKMQRVVTCGRLIMACFTVLGTIYLYKWGNEITPRGGKIAATLFVVQPQILGHGSLLTNDVPVGVMIFITGYAVNRMMSKPTMLASVFIGMALGVAMSLKFTALFMVPLVVFAFVVSLNKQSFFGMLMRLLIVIFVAWSIIGMPYRFAGVLQPLREFPFCSSLMNQVVNSYVSLISELPTPFHAFKLSPLPKEYLLGLDRQQQDFQVGLPSFAAGVTSAKGWWWFYFYSMLVKFPSGTLLICGIGILVFLLQFRDWIRGLWIPFSSLTIMFVIMALKDGFAQQHRYVLTSYPFLFLIVGVVLAKQFNTTSRWRKKWMTGMVYGGLSLSLVSCIVSAPNWLSMFNSFAGGNRSGYKTLFNDASDWGQDTFRIATWLRENLVAGQDTMLLSSNSGYDAILACGASGVEAFTLKQLNSSKKPTRLVISKSDLVWLTAELQEQLEACPKQLIYGTHIAYQIK
jgi:hypothetical protein